MINTTKRIELDELLDTAGWDAYSMAEQQGMTGAIDRLSIQMRPKTPTKDGKIGSAKRAEVYKLMDKAGFCINQLSLAQGYNPSGTIQDVSITIQLKPEPVAPEADK